MEAGLPYPLIDQLNLPISTLDAVDCDKAALVLGGSESLQTVVNTSWITRRTGNDYKCHQKQKKD